MLGDNSADDTALMKIEQRCCHCGEETTKGSLYCKHGCLKAEGRREVCRENKKIFEEAGLEYNCSSCRL